MRKIYKAYETLRQEYENIWSQIKKNITIYQNIKSKWPVERELYVSF